ncbi:PIN domain-containing protein [Gordonia bronchialis]|uniref:PIN domain-containing protein n=1 Tax=Gordonia bronchialis TaxID=2054 RepID=UPI00226DCEBA|nr:PIN domain-containing protein [Gordonia bronchialis]
MIRFAEAWITSQWVVQVTRRRLSTVRPAVDQRRRTVAGRATILERFAFVPMLSPGRDDHIAAADLRRLCRQAGVRLGTIDALIAALTIVHGHTLLTTDKDFVHAAPHIALDVWSP